MNHGTATFWERIRLQIDLPAPISLSNSVHVDLGAGKNPRNPFRASQLIAVDYSNESSRSKDGVEFRGCDLTRRLPFEDNSIDSCSAFDLLEHIPRWERVDGRIEFPFINLISEISRILKPDGKFMAVTPAYPSPAAFQDPTHINFISTETINYFVGENPHAKSIGYGFKGNFKLLFQGWMRGPGVFSETALFEHCNFTSRSGLASYARLARRTISLCSTKNPTHLIWILEKL